MATTQQGIIRVSGAGIAGVHQRIEHELRDLPRKGLIALSVSVCREDESATYVGTILIQKAKG